MVLSVKICGITNRDDALHALDCGADYLGFVLYPQSPRRIDPMQLAHVMDGLPDTCRAVGVFVNMARRRVEQVMKDCRLYAAQLHGNELMADFAGFPGRLWRAVRFQDGAWSPAPHGWPAESYVIDSAAGRTYGGSGVIADWPAAAKFAASHRSFLAGGLNPANVAEAIRAVHPAGVDTASGVESQPGRKDPDRVRDFIRAARSA